MGIRSLGKRFRASMVLAMLFALFACGGSQTETPAFRLKAAELYKDYGRDRAAADEKYKNKTIEVSGTIDDLGRDPGGEAYVALADEGMALGVQCFLRESEAGKFGKLSEGQSAAIIGTCVGKKGDVILRDCRLVESPRRGAGTGAKSARPEGPKERETR